MILRICVCLPVYNNKETVDRVVADCLAKTDFPVLVVDDGSDEEVVKSLHSPEVLEALKDSRLRVVRHAQNLGKGAALQTAFKDCLAHGFTHMLSVDADGQHLVDEFPKLVGECKLDPWALIIGQRQMSGETVPQSSKFGRTFSNYWVKYQTGKVISDSQSGLRIYPLFQIQSLRFFTRKFDFEIEVLIRLLWRGIPIREVEVGCYYPPPAERVTHFDKLWDNVRISLLNTALVVISLLRSHLSPKETSLALGLGVLIGCTPFIGFHTLIVAAVAFFFRLNGGMLLLGSQVSIPPLAPFLAIASLSAGSAILRQPMPSWSAFSIENTPRFFFLWLLGSLVVGTVLGTAVGVISYFVTARIKNYRRKKTAWNGQTRGGALGNQILVFILKGLGLRAAAFCLYFIVPYFYLFAPKARKASRQYWECQYPGISILRREVLILKHFHRFATLLLDRLYQSHQDKPVFQTTSNGFENILGPIQNGQGVILLGAHVGAWDMAGAYVKKHGFQGEFYVLQYEAEGLTFNKVKGKTGGAKNPGAVPMYVNQLSQPILALHALLNQGRPVALMGDRPIGNYFELVPFFGKLAPFDTTAFRVSATCRKPLLFTFGFKGGFRHYEFFASPLRHYEYSPGGDKQKDCLIWVTEFAQFLEGLLRKYPDQWNNFFPFWSAVPSAPNERSEARNADAKNASANPSGISLSERNANSSKGRNYLLEELDRRARPKIESATVPTPNAEAKFQMKNRPTQETVLL